MDRGDHGFAGSPAARHQPGRGSAKARAGVTGGRLPRAARYANEAALRFYLLHEPVIVAAAGLIVRLHALIAGKYAALVIVSFAATFGPYEALMRRFRLTRFLFGTKARSKPSAIGAGTAASSPAPTVGSLPARHTVRSSPGADPPQRDSHAQTRCGCLGCDTVDLQPAKAPNAPMKQRARSNLPQ